MKLTIKGVEVEVDDNVYSNIQVLKEMIAKKFDGIFIVDGMEGSGKSEFAKQWALIQNPNFSEKDVVYTTDQFEEWMNTAKVGDVCLWDEFVFAGLSTDALSEMQKKIIKQFTVMRSRRLTVILVIPYIFMLRKYFAFSRTRFFVHVHTQGMDRGFFKFYNYEGKKWIYNYGHKTWLYSPKQLPSFKGRFNVWSDKILNEEMIELKKQSALKEMDEVNIRKLTKGDYRILTKYFIGQLNKVPRDNPDYQALAATVERIEHNNKVVNLKSKK